ncbi:hypothetical protein D1227_04615 [Henriciella mobilis]|uniref:hypothetical protein n=1 Tax=Henriciella mobilis TaxID=2305467 RepID=UPI000E66AAF1|nr:hypothetical protein [Henriciella mobilis]RIJ17404.1 hypothetical protein D1231_03930 [Henriciella mobilis]RIJ25607.1 hypothetical protein D1227_04615 [Henriciella mobilis]
MRIGIIAALAALGGLVQPVAHADETTADAATPPACPDDAVQQMFNVQMAVLAGQLTDVQQLFNIAENASAACPENSAVQSYASLFYGMVSKSVPEAENQLMLLSKAYDTAIAAEAHIGSSSAETVTLPDGTAQTVYPYGQAFGALKREVFPDLAKLAAAGHVHPIFETETLEACPYVTAYNSSVQFEIDGFAWTSPYEAADFVTTRLEALKGACPHKTTNIVAALGRVNERAARSAREAGDEVRARAYAQAAFDYTDEFSKLPSGGSEWEGLHIAMGSIRADMKVDFLSGDPAGE